MAGPGCVDFLGAASRRRRHGKPIRWSDARASRFLGDPRVQVGGLSRGSLVDGESTSLPREVIVLEKQDRRTSVLPDHDLAPSTFVGDVARAGIGVHPTRRHGCARLHKEPKPGRQLATPALSTFNAIALSVRVKIDFHRQPGCHDLGDGGRDEWLISVLGHQLVALGVHHEHQPLRSEGRDVLLDAGQSRGG